MKFFTGLSTTVAAVCSLASLVQAHSMSRRALDYFSIVDSPTINTPSHRVFAHSEFDITFTLHRNEQRIRLTLEPNHDIIHQSAQVHYTDASGNVVRREPLIRDNHRVFKGDSWVEKSAGNWIWAGWARVVVHKDGEHPQFEGAFGLGSDSHHIQLRGNYMSNKHQDDPDLAPAHREYMIVWRDSDVSDSMNDASYASFLKGSHDFFLESYSNNLAKRGQVTPEARDVTVRADAGSWGVLNTRSLFRRQSMIDGGSTGGNTGLVNLRGAIGNVTGCPKTKKVALMGVATDCTYTGTFNSSDTARDNIITQVNTASGLYESTFNITLGLANLTISDASCPGTAASATPWNIGCAALNVSQRLNAFSQWRAKQIDGNAFWTLLSNCPTGSEVGLSWTGALCQKTLSANSGTSANVVVKTSTEWQVIAHEVGHTFGAVHDCDSSTCAQSNIVASQQCCPVSSSSCDAQGQFIMNPSVGPRSTNKFSPCTVGNICSAMGVNSVNATCLVDNSKVPLITKQQCGNGIVEQGEDCDCGGTQSCGNNACCDPTTCKFKTGAVCDDANESCCRSCQFASSGTVCRASTGVCDPQETCPGNSGSCPKDSTAPDGQDCGGGLQCASGQCTSRDLQCKQLMGTSFTNGKNDTNACDAQSCTVRCASPEFGANTCFEMNHYFLDGTKCGGDGKCNKGTCQGSTAGGQIMGWIDQNRTLVIGIAAGVGGLLLLCILCCIVSCCRRRRTVAVKKNAAYNSVNSSYNGSRGPNGQDMGAQYWAQGAPSYQHQPYSMGQAPPANPLQRHDYAPMRQQSVRYA